MPFSNRGVQALACQARRAGAVRESRPKALGKPPVGTNAASKHRGLWAAPNAGQAAPHPLPEQTRRTVGNPVPPSTVSCMTIMHVNPHTGSRVAAGASGGAAAC